MNEPIMSEHDDDLIVADHPHADQRNWQPGDDDDDPDAPFDPANAPKRFVQFIIRPLTRLRRLMRLPPEMLADIIFQHVRIDILDASQYLEKVAKSLDEKMRKGQQWKCAECGQDIWYKDDVQVELNSEKPTLVRNRVIKRVRRDARYCSQACRQKAFRKRSRVTDRVLDTAAKPSPVTDMATRKAT
jgi:hypothetical protein